MARGLWRGAISFGLINIPVNLFSAKETGGSLHFKLLDKKDFSPIGYKQINKANGREVPRDRVVKGYEYEPHQFVIVTEDDFTRANPKATQTIDIEDFVELEDMDPLLFEKPYFLSPSKSGEKGYVLLKRVLEQTKKVAVAKIVIRKKQHLCAIMPRGEYLILEVLRFAHEMQKLRDVDLLPAGLSDIKISAKELKMAEELVHGMTTPWKPEKYHDTYFEDVMKRITAKIGKGDIKESKDVEEGTKRSSTNVFDLMPLLQQSLAATRTRKAKPKRKAKSKRA